MSRYKRHTDTHTGRKTQKCPWDVHAHALDNDARGFQPEKESATRN